MHLFAAAAQTAGKRELTIEVEQGASLAEVARSLEHACPQLQSLLAISRWAVDHQFALPETVVTEEQEIALIPPVSGG